MDLDELASAIRQISTDPVALKLSELLLRWKSDETNVKELASAVERYIGNTWIANTKEHEEIYRLWSQFRNDAVHGVGGMTMNERLYCFSLIPRFDGTKSDQERTVLYAKLLAHP